MPAIAVLLVPVAFLLYVLFGYPLLVGVLARKWPRPIRKGPFQPSISIILATHNGEAFIGPKLESILTLDYPHDRMQILVVSDGSTDQTEAIAARFETVQVLSVPRQGKPSALNAGMAAATGEILVFTDVRQLLAADSLRLLLENFADPAVGVASAELIILDGNTGEEAGVGLYWKYEFRIRLCLSAIDSIFGATGAYYAVRRELAVPVPADSLLDDMYLPLAAFFRGYRLVVEPKARMFDYPTGLDSEFWRKVRTLAGNYQIIGAYPALLGPGNRLWFHYMSYKFARLLLPFSLLGVFFASLAMPDPWRFGLVGAQLGFYLISLADRWIPDSFPLKKLTAPARTFVTLMAATLCAVSIFFVPVKKLWRVPAPVRKN